MQLNQPLVRRDPSGPLRVLSIGRVSTAKQSLESIDASFLYNEDFLRSVYEGETYIKRLGERASGMIIDRATIQEAIEEIESETWDLVIAEDLSRIYRNPQFQFAFVHTCVDHDTRLICIGDHLDTADENWEVALQTASLRHGLHGPDTRRRVRRNAKSAFKNGGVVLKIKFSYRKLSKDEADSGLFGPKGLRIAKLSEWTPTILEMRSLVLFGWTYQEIADWLNLKGVPTGPYAQSRRWTGRYVKELLEDDILWGLRTFRRIQYTRILHESGKYRRKANPSPETEYCPTLAHMTKEEHDVLKAAMEARADEHRSNDNFRSTRRKVRRSDSFWPAQHANCGACRDKMHKAGADVLKCRNANRRRDLSCWNHVQVKSSLARAAFFAWLDRLSQEHDDIRAVLQDLAWILIQQTRSQSNDMGGTFARQMERLTEEQKRLAQAIKKGGEIPTLVEEMQLNQSHLEKLTRQNAQLSAGRKSALWTVNREELDEQLKDVLIQLAETSFDFAKILRKIIPEFWIELVQALDSNLVRPRGRLIICFDRLLDYVQKPSSKLSIAKPFEVVLDFFEPPEHIAHIERCVAAKSQHPEWSLKQIAAELKIGHMTVKRAFDYVRLMESEGLTTPYRVLTKCPENASRWLRRNARRNIEHGGKEVIASVGIDVMAISNAATPGSDGDVTEASKRRPA